MRTGEAVAIALRQQADYIATRYSLGSIQKAQGCHNIKDSNGNTVGYWVVEDRVESSDACHDEVSATTQYLSAVRADDAIVDEPAAALFAALLYRIRYGRSPMIRTATGKFKSTPR